MVSALLFDLDMTKYIDADRLRAEIEKIYKSEIQPWLSGVSATSAIYDYVLPIIDSLQQEQQGDLASLINEATNVAKRIVDRNSFYNSLPQNLRDKYTSEAWCEILEALSTMKEQEQPEVDLEKVVEFERIGKKIKMTIQELINYYIDSECCDVADECGF